MTHDEKVAKFPSLSILLNKASERIKPSHPAGYYPSDTVPDASLADVNEVDALVAANSVRDGYLYLTKLRDTLNLMLADITP